MAWAWDCRSAVRSSRRMVDACWPRPTYPGGPDRKSTRLNSSHSQISYAVFCLKKKNKHHGCRRKFLALHITDTTAVYTDSNMIFTSHRHFDNVLIGYVVVAARGNYVAKSVVVS